MARRDIGAQNIPVRGYDYWDCHPDHHVAVWQKAVKDGQTRNGYWSWVRLKISPMEAKTTSGRRKKY